MSKAKFAAQVAQLTADRVPFVLATVVRAKRPASVSPGDTAIILPNGKIEGFVGGACAESSVRLYSMRVLETGEPMLLRLTPEGADDPPPDGIEGAVIERNPCLSGGSLEIFLDPQLPSPRMVIVGGSPIARSLNELASAAGYDTYAMDDLSPTELAGVTAFVVASHGVGEEVLGDALMAGVPYVALVASEKRGAAVRQSLGVAPELAAQIRTPAGVDIGARTPAEIAIAILAELVVVLHADPDPGNRDSDDHDESDDVEPAPKAERSSKRAAAAVTAEAADGQPVGENGSAPDGDAEAEEPAAGNDRLRLRSAPEPVLASVAKARAAREAAVAAEAAQAALEAVEGGQTNGHVNGEVEGEHVAGPPGFNPDAPLPDGVQIAIDPICGMQVAITEETLYLDAAGSRRYFCGTGCRVAFAAKYATNDAAA